MRPITILRSIFPGNSEMAQRMRAFNWATNELGSPESWPETLKTIVRIILTSRHPMFIWWGDNLINLHNDGYASFLHTKHPEALGRPASVVWAEIWHDVIAPRIDIIKTEDSGTFDEAMPFVNLRRGYPEETYATFSYSPILNDDGLFGGVICPVSEETDRIIGQRQMALLRQLAAKTLDARNRREACALIVDALQTDTDDIPFALIYELDVKSGAAVLEAFSGITCGTSAAPKTLTLDANSIWPFKEILTKNESIIVNGLDNLSEHLPIVRDQYLINQAIILPIAHGVDDRKGALVLGLSPLRPLDETYKEFAHLICAGVSSAIQNADAYEAEKHRAETLAELDRAKTTFFSNVSHEFRTPLTLMLGPVEDALAKTSEPEQREWLELVHHNALRLHKLVNTLLDFSRIEAGRIEARYELVELAQLTTELSSVFRSAIEKAGLRFVVNCQPLDKPMYVDRDMYEKIVLNLLSNAFKFTLDGEIEVMLRDLESVVELSVADTGSGIPEDQLHYLFKRFHRIEGTPARTHEGTGIGLALIQELVKLHGGSISVKSVVGQGSIFTVTLPKEHAHLPADRVQRTPQLESTMLTAEHYIAEALRWLPSDIVTPNCDNETLNDAGDLSKTSKKLRPRIVWADDNADMRDYITRLLSSNYEVEAVPDGKAALAAVRRQLPDLILADVMMPNLNGFELLHAIRTDVNLQSIPLILLSARAGVESLVEGMTSGADDYLIKPFSARELLARIGAHLKIAFLRAAGEKTLKESEKKLAIELDGAQKLQHISSRLIEESNIEMMYDQILDTAMAIMDSEFSSIQILDNERDALCLLAWKNFHPESARYWQEVSYKTGSICGAALQHNQRVIVSDIYTEDCYKNSESLLYYRLSGIVAVQSTPLTARDGRVLGMISTHWGECYEPSKYQLALFDVLARQMADVLERQRAQEALKEADRRKDEFLAVLAHELRNPLFPVKNAIYLLQQTKNESNNQQLIEIMERQVDHMIRLVDDLLEISRITTGKIELHQEAINLDTIINNALEISKPILDSKHHQVILSLPHAPLVVHVDKVRMTQIFSNLLNNAAKYTPEKGIINVTITDENNNIVVSIKDNGIGISNEILPKVFEMFTQEKSSTNLNNRGLGIGLAMVRSLLDLHGGSVKAFSAGLNQGSEFIVSLPFDKKNTDKKKENILAPEQFSFTTLRILIVDDNPDILDSLTMLLQYWGINVRGMSNGVSALAALDEFNPHIVFLDIGMPDMDGYEVAKKIRQNSQYDSIKLVALTGWSQEKDRIKSKARGFDEHLAKPADFNQLCELLKELMISTELH